MEKHGIGTDATHAEHIEKIQDRSYVAIQDSKFLPGKLGMGLVEGMTYDLWPISLTASSRHSSHVQLNIHRNSPQATML